ncbi:MAG: glycosyltransferase family 4 protein [Deltaproteobacteria bacterium]|nr:glycosyltransferase family 4 protein [Deltaproteobacteria bacterium]
MTSTLPRVLAILPNLIPSTTLTVVKPLLALQQAGHIRLDLTLESWLSPRQLAAADVLVYSRNMLAIYRAALDAARTWGKPFIYDIDDNLFELPSLYQQDVFQLHEQSIALLDEYLSAAALVRVYAAPMQERVQKLNTQVVRVDGPVDWNLVPSAPPVRDTRRVRIVYATSRVTQDDLASVFLEAIQKILAVYHDRVAFYCWGYHPPELRANANVHFLKYVDNYDKFFRRFAHMGFDIGLAPLHDEVFYRSKTNNKFREYAACRIAGVYSDVDVYASCIEHGGTGLLVENTAQGWFEAIARLVDDAALRTRIQQQSYTYVRTHYSLEKTQQEWLAQIQQVLQLHRAQMKNEVTVEPRMQPSVVDSAGGSRSVPPLLPGAVGQLAQGGWRFIHGLRQGGLATARRKFSWFTRNLRAQLYLKWLVSLARTYSASAR